MLGDRDYDCFEYNEHEHLKSKILFALKGPPQKESGYDPKDIKGIGKLYNIIIEKSNETAENRDQVELSVIYTCLEPLPKEKLKKEKNYPNYNPSTDLNPVPVFVLRRCRGSDNPCRIFVDDGARVYTSFQQYLVKNKYPECHMVLPQNGKYQIVNDAVQLEKHLSPACHLDTKLLQVGDIVSTVAGVTSGVLFAAAAIPAVTIAPVVLVGAGVVGATAGVWAIGRSIYSLVDRSIHCETLSFANSEARGAYLNIVAGTLGFAGAGANMALSQLAARGVNIGKGATFVVNGLGVLNLGAGGVSILNSGFEVFDQWKEGRAPSTLTILQLSSSVLFFGHAVFNFKGAQTIVEETQAGVLRDYQDSLRSNRHRKAFNKLVKQTMKNQGETVRGRAEVISTLRNIQNKDEVFAALVRNNKALNKAGIQVAAEDGKITLGGVAVDMNKFAGMNKKQTAVFLNNLSSEQNASGISSNVSAPAPNNLSLSTTVGNLLKDINLNCTENGFQLLVKATQDILWFLNGDVRTKLLDALHQAIGSVLRYTVESIKTLLDGILPKNEQFTGFLSLAIEFFSKQVDDMEGRYKKYQQNKNVPDQDHSLFNTVNPLYAKRLLQFFEIVVLRSFNGSKLIDSILNELAAYISGWIVRLVFDHEEKKRFEEKKHAFTNEAWYNIQKVSCSSCGGFYFTHKSREN